MEHRQPVDRLFTSAVAVNSQSPRTAQSVTTAFAYTLVLRLVRNM
jgi:hypothetical protein